MGTTTRYVCQAARFGVNPSSCAASTAGRSGESRRLDPPAVKRVGSNGDVWWAARVSISAP
jgi:hypothetical protein